VFDSPIKPNGTYFLPLGGTGEIGMNLNLYVHNHRMVMVDCGSMFQDPDSVLHPRPDEFIVPDTRFVEEHRGALEALVLTHAHEDHIGAILALWHRFPTRIYATAFTAEVLRRKVARSRDTKHQDLLAQIVVVEPAHVYQIGPFDIEWLPITHSTLESHGLLIKTSEHTIFHTGDWKFDANPVLGPATTDADSLGLGSVKIDSVVCDSTNALKAGHSVSEQAVYEGLLATVKGLQGRVFVTCFASNVARLVSVAKVAKETGRYLAVVGRAFENMISIARQLGYWPEDLKIYPPSEASYLPRHEVLYLVTGSQGEPRAALSRLSRGQFGAAEMEEGDAVIFSSMRIPGNEVEIARLVANLRALKVTVLENDSLEANVHASGHPCREELKNLYQTLKPRVMVATHGTLEHLEQHVALAKDNGVRRALSGLNGDLFQLHPVSKRFSNYADTGRVLLTSP
jgi:ribonuclease J